MHPDTGEILPQPVRMAGFVPYNGVICAGCVVASTTASQLFFNWLNQSHNAAINYCNRNAATETKTEDIAKSYAAAISAALSVSFGLSMLIQKRFPANAAQLMTGTPIITSPNSLTLDRTLYYDFVMNCSAWTRLRLMRHEKWNRYCLFQ